MARAGMLSWTAFLAQGLQKQALLAMGSISETNSVTILKREIMLVDLSVVIVSWNAKRLLLECLQSLTLKPPVRSMEIIVVDNASTDGSPEAVKEQFPCVKLIQNNSNMGFAKGNNIGIEQSKGRYVCLINSDVTVLNDCLNHMCDYMDSRSSVGILGPKILWPDMTLQDSCRKFPTLWNNFAPAIGLDRVFPRSKIFSGEHMLYFPHNKVRKVDSLVGCFLMVRREAIDQVGLFDEQFFIYSEEVDWCKRFWNAGWEIVFFPDAQVIHYGRGSSSNAPLRFVIEQKRSTLQYWKKHHGWLSYAAIVFIFLFHHMIRTVLGSALYLIKPSQRPAVVPRVDMDLACLRFLLGFNGSSSKRLTEEQKDHCSLMIRDNIK